VISGIRCDDISIALGAATPDACAAGYAHYSRYVDHHVIAGRALKARSKPSGPLRSLARGADCPLRLCGKRGNSAAN